MNLIILAALLTCLEGQASCQIGKVGMMNVVYICDVDPQSHGAEPLRFVTEFDREPYSITIKPKCEET